MYQDESGKQLTQYEQYRALMLEDDHAAKNLTTRVSDLYYQSHELALIPFTLPNIQHMDNEVEKVNHQFVFGLIQVMKDEQQPEQGD